MPNQVIYEKPKLSLWETIKMWWSVDEVFSKGFTPEYIEKMEGKNGNELRGGLEENSEVHQENSG